MTLDSAADRPADVAVGEVPRRVWPAWAPPAAAASAWSQLRAELEDLQPALPPCAVSPETWWSVGSSLAAEEARVAAVVGCRSCPVVGACRAYALVAGEPDGVWGGLTLADRRAIRRGGAA